MTTSLIDLHDKYPLYSPPLETVDDYINLILSGNISFVLPIIVAGLFTWIILSTTEDSDK